MFVPGDIMVSRLVGAVFCLALTGAACAGASAAPLAAHRAAYDISLIDRDSPSLGSFQTPVAATGLIAYEFRGSACDGYTSSFRQMTKMERSEVAPLAMDVNATSLEPAAKTIDFGRDVLFPTQHVERLIDAARSGGGVVQARVYDGSDTGTKIYATMAVIGKEATKPSEDATNAAALKDVRRWPVVVSYFNEASKDSTPEYVLTYDLYENGVSGSLKLDYGTFALKAHLRKLEILPASACAK